MQNRILIIGIVVLCIIVAGCAQIPTWSQTRQPTTMHMDNVQVSDTILISKTLDGNWDYLVDANGITLYTYQKDNPGMPTLQCNGETCSKIWPNNTSQCYGECSVKWPIFYADKIVVMPPLNPSDFGIIIRNDGKKQTTYWGYPLYYYKNDTEPGDLKGNNFDYLWFFVQPA
jgi:predicted lipoprotein with Yx(FWY)xxD motif